MTQPMAPPPAPGRTPSKLMVVSWVLIIASIAMALYANVMGSPFRSSFGRRPLCADEGTCTPAQIDEALSRQDNWLFAAVGAFVLAVILHLAATPSRAVPRKPLTTPWVRAAMAAVIAAALLVMMAIPFLMLAFSGQTPAVVLLILLGTFVLVAVSSLTHMATWARPRRAKLVVTVATLAAPAAALLVALVPVPDNETVATIIVSIAIIATLAALAAGHRLAMSVGQG